MRVSRFIISLAVVALAIASLPERAEAMQMVACAEIQLGFPWFPDAGKHPKELQTVFLVTEDMSSYSLRLNYTLTRSAHTEPLHSAGRLIGQVTVHRNGNILFQSEVRRDRMMVQNENAPWTKEASLEWSKKLDLKPGDIVIFSARFNNTPRLGFSDWATLSGEIPF